MKADQISLKLKNKKLKALLLKGFDDMECEQRLWRAVLISAVVDAVGYVFDRSTNKHVTPLDFYDAFDMIYEHSNDFELLSRLAVTDPEACRDLVIEEMRLSSRFNELAKAHEEGKPILPAEQEEINYEDASN